MSISYLMHSSSLVPRIVKTIPTRPILLAIPAYRRYSTAPFAPASTSKLETIATNIAELNLLEVADLVKLLKTKLNISDIPMMTTAQPAAAQAVVVEEEPAEPVVEKTDFTVKLISIDNKAKVKIIREVKSIMPNMNLVQAKKFVENLPQVLKEAISKEDAEQLKVTVEAAGGTVTID